jgi:hypothetical protein
MLCISLIHDHQRFMIFNFYAHHFDYAFVFTPAISFLMLFLRMRQIQQVEIPSLPVPECKYAHSAYFAPLHPPSLNPFCSTLRNL